VPAESAAVNLPREPGHIVVAGDWHAQLHWSRFVAQAVRRLLKNESPRIILHLGDFGVWRDELGQHYLDRLDRALAQQRAKLYFVDGNHEDFDLLHELAGSTDPRQPVPIRPTITWLPRGYRWRWHDRTWLALGGAVSVNRAELTEGRSWFPAEEITDDQAQRISHAGPADVMVCHDAPANVPLPLPPPDRTWAPADLERSDRHRARLQSVVDVVRPDYLLHGHHHIEHDTVVPMSHGPVMVTGLDREGRLWGNYRLLDVRTMTYQMI
jgi:hypothetical protein